MRLTLQILLLACIANFYKILVFSEPFPVLSFSCYSTNFWLTIPVSNVSEFLSLVCKFFSCFSCLLPMLLLFLLFALFCFVFLVTRKSSQSIMHRHLLSQIRHRPSARIELLACVTYYFFDILFVICYISFLCISALPLRSFNTFCG